MILIALYLLAGAFVIYVISPLVTSTWKRPIVTESPELQDVLYRKEEVLAAIRDVEYDYRMKKITEEDYLQMKKKLQRDAIDLLKKEDAISFAERRAAGNTKARI